MTVEVQYVRMFVDLSKHALDIAKAVRKFDWVKLVGITEIDYTITIDTNNKFDKNRTVRELGREIAKTPLGAYAKMRKNARKRQATAAWKFPKPLLKNVKNPTKT